MGNARLTSGARYCAVRQASRPGSYSRRPDAVYQTESDSVEWHRRLGRPAEKREVSPACRPFFSETPVETLAMSDPAEAASELVRAFRALPVEVRREFIKQLFDLAPPTLETLRYVFTRCSREEQERFVRFALPIDAISIGVGGAIMPIVADVVATKSASASVSAVADAKEARDRKSDPAIVRRNVEICDLRRLNPKKWSFTTLAKKFDLPKSSIQLIVRTEAEWREKARRLTS